MTSQVRRIALKGADLALLVIELPACFCRERQALIAKEATVSGGSTANKLCTASSATSGTNLPLLITKSFGLIVDDVSCLHTLYKCPQVSQVHRLILLNALARPCPKFLSFQLQAAA